MTPLAKTMFSPKLLGCSLILAPALFATSTFFWSKGEYGITGGTIIILSMIFWIPAFIALFEPLREKMPLYTSIGFLVAVYGCISGANFGLIGVFSEAFGISHEKYLSAAGEHSLAFNLLLFWPGPLFPLSLLVLAIIFLMRKTVPLWAGLLLCVGAIAFPLSRIPRIELLAHIADVMLFIPLSFIGLRHFKAEKMNNK